MVSCACGGLLCYYSCWYNECFSELMAVKKTRIAETAPPPNVLLYVGLVCSRFSRCTLQTRCFVVWTSGFRTLRGLNTPNNKPPKADLGLYITGGLVRSVVGRWRLHCYTIKSHCAGLFLALWRDRMCFICNFLRKLICPNVVSCYRRIH